MIVRSKASIFELGELANIKTGKLDVNASSPDGAYPFFTCSREPLRIDSYSYDCECVLVAGNGDLNVKHYSGKFDAYQRTYIVETKDDRIVHIRYLYHFLENYLVTLRKLSIGGVIKYIKLENLTGAKIPLPDLDEQKRIAAILDKADAIRRKRRQALQLTDDFLRSLFLDMFGDPVTNPKGWEVRKSGELFSEKPRIGTTKPANGKGCPVVRVGELGQTRIQLEKCGRVELDADEFNRFKLLNGDVVIARAIGSKKQLGKASCFQGHAEPVVIDSHVMRLRPEVSLCNPVWFYSFITSTGGLGLLQKAGGETAVQFNINGKQACSIEVPLPPIPEQTSFELVWRKVQQSSFSLMQSLNESESLFASLQQRAFEGEL